MMNALINGCGHAEAGTRRRWVAWCARKRRRAPLERGLAFAVALPLAALAGPGADPSPGFARIPAGSFAMGDHHGFVDPKHGSDELPVHPVRLDAFEIGIHDVTTAQYCGFLNSALEQKQIEVRSGGVYPAGGGATLLCETRGLSPYSRIGWDGRTFAVLDGKENHPMVCIRWEGAALYCNWLSARQGRPVCYDPAMWACDFNRSGYRLPTEAEWEYAARGGLQAPYRNFPWGDEADPAKANWPESESEFRRGPMPWTTPVGFYPPNGYGLYDMAGNVWQWCTDWYGRNYYAYGPTDNPPGPAAGSPMPDGKPYHCMRGGSWYNGEFGHSRVSNRDPSYFRGPDPTTRKTDPDGPYFHVGFRVVRPLDAEARSVIQPTPVQQRPGREDGSGAGRGGRQQAEGGGANRPPRSAKLQPDRAQPATDLRQPVGAFVLRSPAVADGGRLPVEFTGDGAASSLPLEWSGEPPGTRSFALIMHHEAPDMTKWYWILYDIPAGIHCLPRNAQGVGTVGSNSVNDRSGYAPPHSKGPGDKTYILTLYALSSPPRITVPAADVDRATLLAAMRDRLLGTAELQVVYARPSESNQPQPP